MKKILLLSLMLTASHTFANSVENELLSAQTAYRKALHDYNQFDLKISTLQSNLNAAEARLSAAQGETERLRAELQQTNEAKQQQSNLLQTAGERLDNAWRAARGN